MYKFSKMLFINRKARARLKVTHGLWVDRLKSVVELFGFDLGLVKLKNFL